MRALSLSLFGILLCGLLCSLHGAAPVLAADEPGYAPQELQDILGSPGTDWKMSWFYQGKRYEAGAVDGVRALTVGPAGMILTRQVKIAGDTQVDVRFRLTTTATRGSYLIVTPELPQPDLTYGTPPNGVLSLSVSAPAGAEQETVNWQLPPTPGNPSSLYGSYSLRNLPEGRLLYPDMVRARVEQDFASLESLNKRWLTARYVIRKQHVQVYLDGRLMQEVRGSYVDAEGYLKFIATEGAQIAAISVKPAAPENPRFVTVDLDRYLNGAQTAGGRITEKSLMRGKETLVGKVPFRIPQPDAAGNDHLDLSRSWARFGLLEGGHDPWEGETARWRGALSREGGRIQLRVPNDRYANLHLLAAFEGQPDTTPVVTAQFYRPYEGHPVNFAGRVPVFTARATKATAIPVTLSNGKKGYLYDVTIPLEPDGLVAFTDESCLDVELTKEVVTYRAFPDPCYYSVHSAGLPSGVQVYGVTFERPAVRYEFTPDQFAHIWTAPEKPSYTATLTNLTAAAQAVTLTLTTKSYDGQETTTATRSVRLTPLATQKVTIPIALTRYGTHDFTLRVQDAGGTRTQSGSLAFLHPDTRERGNWAEGKGPIFGFWDWGGGHDTPGGIPRLEVMVRAGAETSMRPVTTYPEAEQKYFAEHQMQTNYLHYQLTMEKENLGGVEWDPSKPEEMGQALIATMKKDPMTQPSAINKPDLAVFFAEPLLGAVSYTSRPEYYGEPELKMTEAEQAVFKNYLDRFVIGATAIKKEWPNARCLMPWGLPSFAIEYLKYSKEATALMDGPALDVVQFERMPEMQIDQVTFASMLWQLKEQWKKSSAKPWPHLISIEGTSVSPALPGALTRQEEAELFVRGELLLNAYGTTQLAGMPTPFHCAGAWGEQHYGGGMCERLPLLYPLPMYTTFATLTRQLNRMNYIKAVPTGSHSVFCLQYRHYQTGKVLHVFWTLRGTRPVTLRVPTGASLTVYDQMDNSTAIAGKNDTATFTIGTSPCFVWGLENEAVVASLGLPDHSDAKPAVINKRLGNPGDGTWKLSTARDADYETCHPEFVTKFPGVMSASSVSAPKAQGNTALSLHLGQQEKERKVMPFYTTLVPAKPVVIPGKASHLGLWVNAGSDWGRVVYCLRDAKGERWLSVGKKDDWNGDDTHSWARFCFDGWRYLSFELPSNAPYDCFREMGTTFWGYYGTGDQIVDLPLTLEKIIVERRTHVIKLDELLPANPQDVQFGDLYAEYAQTADTGKEAIRLSRLRMDTTQATFAMPNPIADLAKTGAGAAPVITKVEPPEREYDGRRCLVFFNAVPDAQKYDIWVSRYADGRNALLLGKDWTESGKLLTGLYANTDQYLFVVATTRDGKTTPPSPPFKVNLKDMFPMK